MYPYSTSSSCLSRATIFLSFIMKNTTFFPALVSFISLSVAQYVQVPSTCNPTFQPGTDTVIYTVPYTYQQVLSIIGSYKNLTWSGNPDNTVTLNGTDNTVGTARTYDIAGAHVIETITVYSKPPNGPYEEIHTLAPLIIPSLNLSFYGDYDGTTATPICNGLATTFNFTINFCATNATLAAATLHHIHLGDATTVGVFLGNQNFTSCAALGANATSTPSSTASGTSMPIATFTGSAPRELGIEKAWAGLGLGLWIAAMLIL